MMDGSSSTNIKFAPQFFAAGTVLFYEGDASREMYVIQSGRVRLSRLVGGKETVLAEIPTGEFFGEMAILNNQPRSATAMVVEDSRLLVLDERTFDSMIRNNSEIAVRMIKRLADRLAQANEQTELLLRRDPNHRVVQYLRQLAKKKGEPTPMGIAVAVDESYLAHHVGLSLDEVRRVLERLERARLVTVSKQGFVISEVGKLQEFLDFLELTERFGS
jgi:CRP-like cAMP-binding protein